MSLHVLRRDHGLAIVSLPGIPPSLTLAVRPPSTLCFVTEADPPADLERALAIARLLSSPAAPRVLCADTGHYRFIAKEAVLGVGMRAFLARHEEEGGTLDDVVAGTIGARLRAYAGDFERVTGEQCRVDLDDVWLGWDGSVRVYAAGESPLAGAPWLEASITRALGRVGSGDTEGAGGNARDRDAALASLLAALFRDERARDRAWEDELFIEEITASSIEVPNGPSAAELVHSAVIVDDGHGPPLIVTDLFPCSIARALADQNPTLPMFARFRDCAPTGDPLVKITIDDAFMLAAWLDPRRGANAWRPPSEAEYDRYARGAGVGRVSAVGVRGLCRLWELTTTLYPGGGVVVRGGQWRDRATLPTVDLASFEDRPEPDVGFRAVRYVNDDDAPWESRT